jgi:WD40 repeat protein
MSDQHTSNKIPPGLKLRHTLEDPEKYIRQIAWSPDGLTLASSTKDSLIRLWNPESGQLLRSFEWQDDYVKCFAWSPDSRLIASGHDARTTSSRGRRTIRIWNAQTMQLLQTISEDVWGQISSLAWSPDGRSIASAGSASVICIRHAETGRLLQIFDEPRDSNVGTTDLAWSPDGRWNAR